MPPSDESLFACEGDSSPPSTTQSPINRNRRELFRTVRSNGIRVDRLIILGVALDTVARRP